MNKELFVSSTPHEAKVGLVEDDLLAEVYLERENEYTLAGSIYKGRVTRVLPGMQSAFVDIGLERDAFLYVSDFMELEEHDEDMTESVPAGRGVQDLRPQGANGDPAAHQVEGSYELAAEPKALADASSLEPDQSEGKAEDSSPGIQPNRTTESQERDRGWRGRRRRRGGRRDGRDRDSRSARPPAETNSFSSERSQESGSSAQFGPPAGYQPIILPGESISKYRGIVANATPSSFAKREKQSEGEFALREESGFTDPGTSVTAAFPNDEPVFATQDPASANLGDPRDTHDQNVYVGDEASTRGERNPEFPERHRNEDRGPGEEAESLLRAPETVASEPAFAASGTLEEETIEEEEADDVPYEGASEEGYDEFEEETRAAGEAEKGQGEISEVRETVAEIHMSSMADSGSAVAATSADSDEDEEELELEEAQEQAEAMLDAEARGNGTVDARAEVRAPSTAGYTQRATRSRPAYERRSGRRGPRRFARREPREVPKISDLLKEGQEILVQIAKEPIGKKGARITSHIALPGRFLVYMPTVNHTGVSRKIASEEERQRLKRIVISERDNGHGGFIVRTAAQNASEEELRADIRFLKGLWNDIKTRAENSKPPALIYHDLNVVERVLRDQVTSEFSVIWVDTEPEYERILRFFNRFQPGLVKRVKLYTKEMPLFEQFGLSDEMNKALKSKVWLKSGGYIVINQTEALVAIDINTGKYVGKTSRLEDTIVKTNVDAIKEIVRQIRLRDLGGIIIIDFIDMDERRNRQRVMQALEEELKNDRAPSKVLQFNDFGLVAITRKRVKQSLERTIGAPCPYCQSTGYVKSVTTVCNEIYVEMRKIAKHLEHEDVMLRVNPDVAKELKAGGGRLLNEMEELTKRTIIVKSDPALHQEQFDIN